MTAKPASRPALRHQAWECPKVWGDTVRQPWTHWAAPCRSSPHAWTQPSLSRLWVLSPNNHQLRLTSRGTSLSGHRSWCSPHPRKTTCNTHQPTRKGLLQVLVQTPREELIAASSAPTDEHEIPSSSFPTSHPSGNCPKDKLELSWLLLIM